MNQLALKKERAKKQHRRREAAVSGMGAVRQAAERCVDHFSAEVGKEWAKQTRRIASEARQYRNMSSAIKSHPSYKRLAKRNQELEAALQRAQVALSKSRASPRSHSDDTETRQAGDGNFYTFDEFCKYYGGLYWTEACPRADPVRLRVQEKTASLVRPVPEPRPAPIHTRFSEAHDDSLEREPMNEVIAPALLSKPVLRRQSHYQGSNSSSDEETPQPVRADPLSEDDDLSALGAESEDESVVSVAPSTASGSVEEWADGQEDADAALSGSESVQESDSESAEDSESEGEEVMEIELEGVSYYASGVVLDEDSETGFAQECDGIIYSVSDDGDVGEQVGSISAGVPCIA